MTKSVSKKLKLQPNMEENCRGELELDHESDGGQSMASDHELDDEITDYDADVDSNKSKEKKRKFSDFKEQLNSGNISLRALKKFIKNTATNKAKLKSTRSSLPESIDSILLDLECDVKMLTKEELLAALTGSGWKDPGNLSWWALRKICEIKLRKELKKPEIERTLHQKVKQIFRANNVVQRWKQRCSRKE